MSPLRQPFPALLPPSAVGAGDPVADSAHGLDIRLGRRPCGVARLHLLGARRLVIVDLGALDPVPLSPTISEIEGVGSGGGTSLHWFAIVFKVFAVS